MNVWSENIFSDDENSDYEIVASGNDSDSDMSMPSLEDAPLNEDEEMFVEEATMPSPNSIAGSIINNVNASNFTQYLHHYLGGHDVINRENLLTPTGYRNLGQGRNRILMRNTSNVVPRSQGILREVQRNLLIEIDTQDCVDKMIETLEINYQNPFAIKIQTIVRGFLARKKMIYLKKVQTANKTTHSCCVCYNDLHSLNMSVTPCGHYYCSTCLFTWMNQKNTCAMCRTALYRPNIDINQLDRSTRRSVRYHSRLQRRIIDLEMNKIKLQDEETKIIRSANQAMARQVRMRGMLAETRRQIENEEYHLDEIYDQYLDLINDCKTEFNMKIKLEEHLNEKLNNSIQKFNDYKDVKINRKRIAEKLINREYKKKIKATHQPSPIVLTLEVSNDDTDYDGFASFWDNIDEENEDQYEIVSEVML